MKSPLNLRFYEVNSPPSAIVSYSDIRIPNIEAICTELCSRYEQACLSFTLAGTLTSENILWDKNNNGSLDIGAYQNGDSDELGVFSQERKRFTGKVNVIYVRRVRFWTSSSSWERVVGSYDGRTDLIFISIMDCWDAIDTNPNEIEIGASNSFERVVAHEVGHLLALSKRNNYPGDPHHDAGPFSDSSYKTISLMRSGLDGPSGKWMCKEDWIEANYNAKRL